MDSPQARFLELWRALAVRRPVQHPMVRVGGRGDGGYLLCDDLAGVGSVVSFGIGTDVSFDLDLARRGLPVYQFDHTVPGPPVSHELFRFHGSAWGPAAGPGVVSLESLVAGHPRWFGGDGILKFDVEGAEWQSLDATPPGILPRFRFIVGEFHWLGQAARADVHALFMRVFRKLLATHSVIHVHANNACPYRIIDNVPVPELVEVTFYRHGRDALAEYAGPLPCELDAANDPARPEIILRA